MQSLPRKVVIVLMVIIMVISCRRQELIIFHAGSLSGLVHDLEKAFPNLSMQVEASGSLEAVRKVVSLNKPCDVLMLSDAGLVDSIPSEKIASCYIFAYNKLVLVYDKRRFPHLSQENWLSALVHAQAKVGRSNPCLDPCGYRALLALTTLSKNHSEANELIHMSTPYIRPKETDLNTYFDIGAIDAFFTYENIAITRNYPYIQLPDSINFSNANFEKYYRSQCVEVDECGKKVCGGLIAYALVTLKNGVNQEAKNRLIVFLSSKEGQELIRKHGFMPTWQVCKQSP